MGPLSPTIRSVVNKLREAIQTGRFAPGSPLPAERDLASEFAVSRTVVRFALEHLAREELIVVSPRCRPVVASKARQVQSDVRKDVAVWLWPSASGYAASLLLSGIQSAFAEVDHGRLVIGNAVGDDWASMCDSEARFLRSIAADPNIGGAILWYVGGKENRRDLDQVQAAGVQIVFVDRFPDPNYPADYVGTDNTGSAEAVVRHLLQQGHQRIGCLQNLDAASSVGERVEGWRSALRREGVRIDEDLCVRMDPTGRSEREQIATSLRRLLELPEPPTAIFCINDLVALTAWEVLRSWNIDVPSQLALAGFDGLATWLPGRGQLTTAVQDFRRIGEFSARIILDRISGRALHPHRHMLLSAPLLALESSAHAPCPVDFTNPPLRERSNVS